MLERRKQAAIESKELQTMQEEWLCPTCGHSNKYDTLLPALLQRCAHLPHVASPRSPTHCCLSLCLQRHV